MRRTSAPLAALGVGLTLACGMSLSLGVQNLTLSDWIDLLRARAGEGTHITLGLRLPRMTAGFAVGAALGLSGAILQGVTRNPLAAPGLIGVTAGAAFAVVLLAALSPAAPALGAVTLAALAGACMAGGLAFALAGGFVAGGATPMRLILSGAVVSMALAALTSAVLMVSVAATSATQAWLAGSLADRPVAAVQTLAPPIALLCLLALLATPVLAVLMLGDAAATSLGLRPRRWRLLLLALATALAALATALAGPISFIGLAAPHLARGIAGSDPRHWLPVSALTGALLLMLADVAARLVAAPNETPVGVLTALIGVPVLLWLLRRGRA